jgi:hypothetical protein
MEEQGKDGVGSLMSQYFGVYKVRVDNMCNIYCVLMDNLFSKDFTHVMRVYDLKGSTKGRQTKLT